MAQTILRMAGAIITTIGSMMAHEKKQAPIQWLKRVPVEANGALAMAAAIAQVIPDWIAPKT